MSEFKATASQKAAIEERGSTVLVSAGAGSGKTKVLTERLMGYIKDGKNPVDVDSFLIITFTKAAAGELRGRIMEELAKALAEDPGNKRLRRQSALCRRAQIGPIHSFCAKILRENALNANINPDFKILDDDRAAAMKASALERVMDKRYEDEEKYENFALLADTVGAGRDDSRLSAAVMNLSDKMQSHARPEAWAKAQVELLEADIKDAGKSPWGREILTEAKYSVDFWRDEFELLLEDIEGDEKISRAYLKSFSSSYEALQELSVALQSGWDRARQCLPVPFPRLGGLRNPEDPELAERLKARRELCKKSMDKLGKTLADDSKTLLKEMAQTAPAMKALLELALDFDKEYAKDKKRAGVLDYNDLEHLTARLLSEPDGSPTELAKQISQRYTEIMVDEYQDVSRVQDAIFHAVSKEGKNLFFVGDVKQSIYRFRLADPEIFTEKYMSFKDSSIAPAGEPRRIMLQENFRSRKEILEGANAVFSICMSRQLGDLQYGENEKLKYGADFEGSVPKPEIMILELPETEDDEERPDKSALEARMLGRKIKELMESNVLVGNKGSERPLQYGDIAILLRSANAIGPVYRRELAAMGIPVESGLSGGYFTSIEVSTLISMLAVIDNPHQDIPLVGVLRSPAFGFSGDELIAARENDKKISLYESLLKHEQQDEKIKEFLLKLRSYREISADITASELLFKLVDELHMQALCGAMRDGEIRKARIAALLELSKGYEKSGYKGLHRFVLWLKNMEKQGKEPPMAAGEGSAVQIMSVHKSKGLEFPVVFLADTARRFNMQDSRDTVIVHPVLGLGPKLTDTKRRVEYPTLARNAVKQRLERETLSEELRLLYVAMTRAKERLYITAAMKDPMKLMEKAENSVSNPMAPEILSQSAALINWLIYAALADNKRNLSLNVYACTQEGEAVFESEEKPEADGELIKELSRNLSFSYPHKQAEGLPSKLTATELKGRLQKDEDAEELLKLPVREFSMPDFTKKDKPLTGTARGIATHLLLQYMDFSKGGSPEEVKKEAERLMAQEFLSPQEADAVDAEAVARLFNSPLGKRMQEADRLQREFRFSLLWDAEELYSDCSGEKLLMQGVVDCFLEEQDGLVIIDYKTDYIKSKEELIKKRDYYAVQMEVYAKSLSKICGKPVKECILYFISIGEALSLDFQ